MNARWWLPLAAMLSAGCALAGAFELRIVIWGGTEAWQIVTQAPAAALDIADRYGSLQPGQVANVVIWSGDPFEFSSHVEHLFIRGVQIPLVSRQTELFDRYQQLPPLY